MDGLSRYRVGLGSWYCQIDGRQFICIFFFFTVLSKRLNDVLLSFFFLLRGVLSSPLGNVLPELVLPMQQHLSSEKFPSFDFFFLTQVIRGLRQFQLRRKVGVKST